MQPTYIFSDSEKEQLFNVLSVTASPYVDYDGFNTQVKALVSEEKVPTFFVDACHKIFTDRKNGVSTAHLFQNCPIDEEVPVLSHDNPFADKVAKKKTFVGEALLTVFSQLADNPLLAYGNRFDGCFFADVFSDNKYNGHDSQFGDTELAWHNDRTAHPVRADYTTLVGMRCPESELIFTGFVSGESILEQLTDKQEAILRGKHFVTPSDIHSATTTAKFMGTDSHAILSGEVRKDLHVRFRDGWTIPAESATEEAKDAYIAFLLALARAKKVHHRIKQGELFTFANQGGLHNREMMEVTNSDRARERWLLKTYSFASQELAERYISYYKQGAFGCVDD